MPNVIIPQPFSAAAKVQRRTRNAQDYLALNGHEAEKERVMVPCWPAGLGLTQSPTYRTLYHHRRNRCRDIGKGKRVISADDLSNKWLIDISA